MKPVRQDGHPPTSPIARLGLWDATSLIVGIIIGVGIFRTPSDVFRDVPELWPALSTWVAGGVLALVGAFCFAELSSTYPRSGGEYVYLTRAFGPMVGFVYAWTQLVIIRPASIGAVAFIFAIHMRTVIQMPNEMVLMVALLSIALLTAVNVLGVTLGKNTQNLLTVLKVIGLCGILVVGLGWGQVANLQTPATGEHTLPSGWFAVAMIAVLWTYAGWHEAAYIASEVRDNQRNLPLSLILGTVLVAVLYLLVNLALVLGLGIDNARSPSAAADLVGLAWPVGGPIAMSVLIMISALGALNGMIFTTARIAVAFGDDHTLFSPLTRWSRRYQSPVRALIAGGVITIAFVIGVYAFGPVLNVGQAGTPQNDPFSDLIDVTAAVFWGIFLMTGIALFMLRWKDPHLPRPFPVPGYPVVPIVFCLMCAYMLIGSLLYRPLHSLGGFAITLIGLPLYFLQRSRVDPPEPVTSFQHADAHDIV